MNFSDDVSRDGKRRIAIAVLFPLLVSLWVPPLSDVCALKALRCHYALGPGRGALHHPANWTNTQPQPRFFVKHRSVLLGHWPGSVKAGYGAG